MADWNLRMFNEWGIAGLYVVSDDNIDFPVAKICDQYKRVWASLHDVLVSAVRDDASTMANARLIALAPKLRDRVEAIREDFIKISKLPMPMEVYNEIEKQVSEITKTLNELEVNDVDKD